MSSFEVAWNRRRLEWRRRPEDAPWLVEAVLLERVLLAGRPQLKIVCRIAAIDEDLTGDTAAQEMFWHAARAASRRGNLFARGKGGRGKKNLDASSV
jgi:hypothetical protein